MCCYADVLLVSFLYVTSIGYFSLVSFCNLKKWGKLIMLFRKQVRVLALTDHDTMNGIPEAVEAASAFEMRIIPGVEISALFSPRCQSNKYFIS